MPLHEAEGTGSGGGGGILRPARPERSRAALRADCPHQSGGALAGKAIAPRPLLILNGEKDDRCPLEGVRRCYAAAESAYRKRGALDRLKMIIAPDTGHAVTAAQRAAALEWFERWLGDGSEQ